MRGPDLRRVDAYRFDLPEGAIAKQPADPPDSSRLLVLDHDGVAHERFSAFPKLLRAGDVLVINETRVVRARLRGERIPGGGAAEVLLLRPAGGGPFDPAARDWEALVRPGRKLRVGDAVRFGAAILSVVAVKPDGVRVVRFDMGVELEAILDTHGELPLPLYVGPGDEARAARYQTIFARVPGSVAAPTASLHFTEGVLAAVRARGVAIEPLVLDVGLGTFKPMAGETIDEHAMHAERYEIPEATAAAVRDAKREGRRVIVAGHDGAPSARGIRRPARRGGRGRRGDGALHYHPASRFRVADALLTNFHLPGSTLLVLVSAFGGYERVRVAYRTAIDDGYRFYSFGDAMFVTRA